MRLLLALRNGFLDGLLNVLLGGGVVGQLGNALRDQDLNDGPEKDEQAFLITGPYRFNSGLSEGASSAIASAAASGDTSPARA
jgi:hypothetical protein